MDLYHQIRRNRSGTIVLIGFFIVLFIMLGLGIDFFYGAGPRMPLFTVLALGIALVASYSGYAYGDRMVLSSTHAREPDCSSEKELQWRNVVEEMSIAAGIPSPAVYVIDDQDPNAFATGRDPAHASIAATKGLLEVLSREELQAVAAHEISHIKNFDTRLMLLVTVLVGSIALIADWAGRMLFFGRSGRGRKNEGGSGALMVLALWIVALLLSTVVSQLIAMCVSRKREYLADASGAELTRNPLALAAALEKIGAAVGPTRSISQGTAHLCIEDPRGRALNGRDGWFADLFATHPPIAKRVEILKQMAYVS
ncbi:MAG: M48 family metallopeptidase [Candidatus Omnitrophota bacterium]